MFEWNNQDACMCIEAIDKKSSTQVIKHTCDYFKKNTTIDTINDIIWSIKLKTSASLKRQWIIEDMQKKYRNVIVVGGFSSEVVTSGAKPPESRDCEEERPMFTQCRHVIDEAIVGDCLHSSTREDSRWGLYRRWGPSYSKACGGKERTGQDWGLDPRSWRPPISDEVRVIFSPGLSLWWLITPIVGMSNRYCRHPVLNVRRLLAYKKKGRRRERGWEKYFYRNSL